MLRHGASPSRFAWGRKRKNLISGVGSLTLCRAESIRMVALTNFKIATRLRERRISVWGSKQKKSADRVRLDFGRDFDDRRKKLSEPTEQRPKSKPALRPSACGGSRHLRVDSAGRALTVAARVARPRGEQPRERARREARPKERSNERDSCLHLEQLHSPSITSEMICM